MRLLVVLATLFVAALLAACTGMPRAVEASRSATLRNVAVASLLGDDFKGVKVGITVFGNAFFSGRVPEWQVDAYAARKAAELLAPRFHARPLSGAPGATVGALADQALPALLMAARAAGADGLLLIEPKRSGAFPMHAPPFGFHDRKIGAIPELPGFKSISLGGRCVYAMYVVRLLDVASGEELAMQWGGDEPCRSDADNDLFFAMRFEDYSDAQRSVFRERLYRQLDRGLGSAIGRLGLAP